MPSPDPAATTVRSPDEGGIAAGRIAWAVALGAAVALGGAWLIQAAGYAPCELCLRERVPYYLGMPIALLSGIALLVRWPRLARLGMAVVFCCFAVGTLLAVYHAGVEWGFWAGPSACSGQLRAAADVGDFLRQLDHVKVVRCDRPALVVLGVSLAGWNALVSALLAALAAWGLTTSGLHRPRPH